MVSLASRARLLGSAALGLGLTMVAAQPAQAACTITSVTNPSDTVDCATNTTTTNTTGSGPTDRHYSGVATYPLFAVVPTGVTVNGYGLAITSTGTSSLTVTNNGTIQVDVGLTPTAGGDGALSMTSVGGSALIYQGTGNIFNLGVGNGLDVNIDTTGSFTGTIGGNVTSGTGSYPTGGTGILVDHTGTAGNVAVTTTAGRTIRADYAGIILTNAAAHTGSLTVTNNAAIASLTGAPGTLDWGIAVDNNGTGALTIVNNGAIGSTTDRILVRGIEAINTNAASTAALSVTGSGAIWSAGTGIYVQNSGTGTNTVNYTGAINTTGATGVDVTGTTGATSVTLGGVIAATDAVNVTSTGAQTITLNGVTTGTAGSGLISTTTGARTITVGAAGNVTGGTQAILLNGTGATTMTNNGIIGAASTGLAINAAGAGAVTLTNAAGATINGRFTLSANNDTVTNNGTMNVQGALDFGAGTDRLVNSATGIITLTGNTSLVGLENLGTGTTQANAGRINLATFTLTGPAILLTNAATGLITTTGSAGLAGFTALTNAGTITLGAGTFTAPTGTFTNSGTVNAKLGATTITGQTSFVNAGGLISLQDGATNDVLTINSNFAASGNSRLALDIDNTTADRLIINGNVTGTATNVLLTPIAGTTGFDTAGILIVDVTGTTVANAFTTTSVLNPIVNFAIEQRGVDYFVVRVPNAAAFSPVLVGNLVLDTWYQGAEAFNAMAAARGGESDGGIGLWLQPYYGRDRYGSSTRTFTTTGGTFTIPTRMRTKRHGIQGGVDFNAGVAAVGLTGGYQHAEINNGSPSSEGWNIGAYAMAGGTAGMYGNVLVKYDNDKQDLDFGAFSQSGTRTESTSLGADGEIGFRFPGSGSVGFDASAGLAYVNAKIDTFSFGGVDFDYDTVNSLRGRIGARAVFFNLAKMFVGGKLMHEFNGDTDLLLDSTTDASVSNRGRGTWGRLEGGFGGGLDTPFMLMGWGDFGDVKGWGVRGGVRLSFGGARVAEMAPPPPPPPPPPAYEPAPVVEEYAPPPPPPPPPAAGERG